MSLACTRCTSPLPVAALAARQWTCATCAAELELTVFPSLWQPPPLATPGEALSSDSEAACFYHPAKRAAVACDGCGRFLCALCEVELGGGHFCPPCIESGKHRPGLPSLENHRTLWDRIALSVALLPMVVFYVTLVTGPIAVYLSVRHWRSPGSLLGRSRWRFVLAIIIGSVQAVGMVVLIVAFVVILRRTGAR